MSFILEQQGFYADLPINQYADDPCPTPSLDTQVARAMRDKSARHARWAHRRFNPDAAMDSARVMDVGGAFHSIVLEDARDIIEELPYEDYKTGDARLDRDIARDAGKIPLLMPDQDRLAAMIEAFTEQGGHDMLGGNGQPELSGFFQVGDAWFRTRPDWTDFKETHVRIISLKTVTGSASRDDVERRIVRDGWDLQAGLHALGIEAVFGREASVSWLVVEQEPPYGIALWPFAPAHLHLARSQAEFFGRAWHYHVKTDGWPSYTPHGSVGYRKFDADTIRIRLGIDSKGYV